MRPDCPLCLTAFGRLTLVLIFLLVAFPLNAESPADWYAAGERWIAERRQSMDDEPAARNIILFVGDGMSLSTVAAARILQGQRRGQSGEENLLAFERFPYTGLAKTYNTNQQVPDSAGTMTAMATGVKTSAGVLGVDQMVRRGDCASVPGRERVSILELAALDGLHTGIVTTTRITHATPAALFAKSPDRGWESDRGLPPSAKASGCRDLADQLTTFDTGAGIQVILGGGRAAFLPRDTPDPEYPEQTGIRQDGRNLVEEWQTRHPDGDYVWDQDGFDDVDPGRSRRLLGLFEPGHMHYEHDRPADRGGEPSIAEMTRKAIQMLQRGDKGFFLMVEGGRIDHAHHAVNAWRALTDTLALDKAVEVALELTDQDDTLVIVTADHGHALTFGGYAARGNDIMGLVRRPGRSGSVEPELAMDRSGEPYTALGYINGPGYRGGIRPDYDRVDPGGPEFRQESSYLLSSSTHSGEDVPVYAVGPGAEWLTGVMEQNVLFHAMVQANPGIAGLAELLKGADGLPDRSRLDRVGCEIRSERRHPLAVGMSARVRIEICRD